jgi:acyl-CoA reductase-like NAD-dependent aldehyde dehydrogenase
MNDSPYGLTASIWTSPTDPKSLEAFRTLSEELESERFSHVVPIDSFVRWLITADPCRTLSSLSDLRSAGTVFLNRCDCLDPALAWTGVKNSGRGVSLSPFGTLSSSG